MNKLDGMSLNVGQVEMEKLKSVFPQCFAEGKLDIDKLLSLCGEYIDKDGEKYQFEWNGKRESLKLAQTRSMGTLRPAPAESVDWDTTQNLYIEGDNLEVLKLLQTAYYRRVKMIYIDPPYNTGNDFVYNDDFADPMSRYKEITSQMTKSNPEVAGRYHTNWLNMMYPRLRLAANLLRDDGVIFISIDDNEVHNLRKVCDEVFGEENFVGQFNWFKSATPPNLSRKIKKNIEYILCYEKHYNATKYSGIKKESKSDDPFTKPQNSFKELTFPIGSIAVAGEDRIIPKGTYGTEKFPNELCNDLEVVGGKNANAVKFFNRFIWLQDKLDEEISKGTRVNLSKGGVLSYKKADYDPEVPPNLIDKLVGVTTTEEAGKEIDKMLGEKVFDYPKPISLICYLINFVCEPDDIIFDFFSGSGTTAHAVMQLNAEDGGNRKFIMVQLPEQTDEKSEAFKAGFKNICEIGKERIRRAGAKIKAESGMFSSAIDTGFKVFKLDDSNLVAWNTTPIKESDLPELWDRFTALTETIKGNRSELDVVYEVMAKMGVPLTHPVREMTVGTKKTYSLGDNMLLVCLEKGITPEDVEAMCELAPYWLIAAEAAFADDTALSNAHYTVKARNIKMELL